MHNYGDYIRSKNNSMKTKNSVYQAPEMELMLTEGSQPLCASATGMDPFTGKAIGDEF